MVATRVLDAPTRPAGSLSGPDPEETTGVHDNGLNAGIVHFLKGDNWVSPGFLVTVYSFLGV